MAAVYLTMAPALGSWSSSGRPPGFSVFSGRTPRAPFCLWCHLGVAAPLAAETGLWNHLGVIVEPAVSTAAVALAGRRAPRVERFPSGLPRAANLSPF